MNDSSVEQAMEAAVEHHRAGRLHDAERIYRRILAQEPKHPDALHLLGLIAQQVGQHAAAVKLLTQATQGKPETPEYRLSLGKSLQATGEFELAAREYATAVALNPQFAEAHHNLATVLGLLGRADESIAAFRRTVELAPEHAGARCNLGIALSVSGRFEEALAELNEAITLDPDSPDVHYNLGVALSATARHSEASNAFSRVVQLRPDYAEAHSNLGMALNLQGRIEEAVSAFRAAIAIDPTQRDAHDNLLLALNYRDADRQAVFDDHVRWAERHDLPLRSDIQPLAHDRDPHRRLRIGYVSGDFWSHAVGFFIEPAIVNHDPNAFEVFCYSDATSPDAVTTRIRSAAEKWREIAGVSDEQVAQMIRDDGIDILVDLAGHTSNNRLLVFARKPAPIQATYLGYPNTTGMSAIDYRITDAVADPPGGDAFHTEKLLRLPRTAWCYHPPMEDPSPNALPMLTRGHVRFGSFNNLAKISADVIATWAKILAAVPNSQLLIKAAGLHEVATQRRLRDAFSAHGIDEARIELRGITDTLEEHLRAYHNIDVALDTFPYNGTTTTCEAMWMGVPVVTLAGGTHASRVGCSLLMSVGLPQFIANSEAQYIRLPTDLAGNDQYLRELRGSLRDRMKQSPLMDGKGFARDLEQAFRTMWQARGA